MRMKLINRIKKFAQFALAFGLVSSASADQYFKFVVTHRRAGNTPYDYVEVGELALFNASGTRVNLGLTRDASLSTPNTFSFYHRGEVGSPNYETAEKLFDGGFGWVDNQQSKLTCQLINDGGQKIADPPTVIMRLTTDDEIVAYNLASAEANLGERIATGWELYRGADGTNEWILIDKRTPGDTADDPIVVNHNNTVNYTWYNNGGKGVNGKNPTTAYRIGGGSVTSWHFLDLLASDPRRVVSSPLATGGDIILKDGDDYIHVFTNAAAASPFTAKESLNARVLVVGGGGAGGYNCAGGGGAGAVIFHPSYSITEGSVLSVKVGAGGAATTDNVVGGSGGASVIRSDNEGGSLIYQADGGGGGATWGKSTTIAAGDGGCGGGGATANNDGTGDDGKGALSAGLGGGVTECTMPQGATKYGCAGGRGWRAGPSDDGAGGGGGAQTQGANGAHNIPGKGGDGVVCTILGGGLSQQAFGGGGGGGGSVNNTSDKNPASGGTGGGGAGGYNRVNATSGEDGLGGGGGGGNGGANTDSKPANGGSGLVVIRYSTMRDRWYRFTVSAEPSAIGHTGNGTQLAEFALYDAEGNRLNLNLTKAAGTCESIPNGDSSNENIDKIFDGNPDTKIFSAGTLKFEITMRVSSVAPAVSYNLMTANDHEERAPRKWTLEYSEDGTNWIVIDAKSVADVAKDPAIYPKYQAKTWFFDGGNAAEPTKKCAITGLTPISYVASDGTQYVDTHYTPNAKTRVVLDYEMTAENGAFLFGIGGKGYGKSLYSRNAPESSSMSVCRDDVFDTVVEISGSTDVGVRHVLDVGATAILLDGVAQPNYPTANPLSGSCEGSAFLFALNQGGYPGTPWAEGDWVSMRVYSLKFYEDDELVFDAVPMLDAAGTPGLYDNVSGRFLKSATTTPLLAPNCYYKVGSDADHTGASFAKSANSTCGWSETRGGTVIANHNVSSEYEYYVDSGLVLYTTHNATADETFAGASLVLRGTLAMKGHGNTVTVNRLIAKGGVIGQWYQGYTQKLAGSISIAEGDSLTLNVTSAENMSDRRDLTIASAISGAGDLILSAARDGQGTIVLLSGDNAEFTGTIKTPDAFNNPLTLQVTGDFGGTITSLPAAEKVNAIAFNYDGLAGGSGLRVIGSEFPAALKTKLTLFSATTDFNQMNLPLVTFPAGQFLQASDFTVKHATSVDGSGTAFTGLAIIPNGDGTETLVANAASGIYFVTAEATAGTGTGLSWLSPLTLQEAFTAICGAAVGSTNAIYMKVGTYTNPSGPWTATINPCFIRILGGYLGVNLARSQTDYTVLDGENAHGLVNLTVSRGSSTGSKSILFDQIEFRNGKGAYRIKNNDLYNYWSKFNHCRFIDNFVPAGDTTTRGSAIEVVKGSGYSDGTMMSWVCVENCEFRGNKSCSDSATTIYSADKVGNFYAGIELSHSLFVGNSSKVLPCVAQFGGSKDNNVTIESCTFAYNAAATKANRNDSNGGTTAGGGVVLDERDTNGFTWKVSNTIFFGNRCKQKEDEHEEAREYWVSNPQGNTKPTYLLFEKKEGYEWCFGDQGDPVTCHYMVGDPMFVTPQPTVTFDPTSYMPTWSVDPSAMDVHLKSVGGRWNGSAWVKDDAMSPAIDAGDPDSDCANELAPNGGRINLGAYGNTAEASKSVAETDAATVSSASGYSEIKQLDNGHTVLIFSNVTDAASFTVAKGGYARVLVVGGGGSGGSGGSGYGGGGGGAGGVVASDAQMLDAGEYTVVVGNSAKDSSLKNSADTVLITAVGGGAGGAGCGSNPGANGGSGGGGGGFSSVCSGGEGVSGQGNAGGYNSYYAGGGGGGFSSAGKSASNYSVGGDGGNGYASDITGEMYGYACGGGGSGSNSGTPTMGVGGSVTVDGVKLILGGNGSKEKGGDAVSGTGSGGGGGCSGQSGGKGGSGIVVVHLYTRWDASKVTLNPNGGVSGGQDEVAAAFGSALPTLDPAKLPMRTNYTFGGYARKWWEVTKLTGNETDILIEGTGKWAYTAHAGYSLNGVFFENRLVINQTSMGNIEVNTQFVQVDRYQTGPDDWEGTQEDLFSDYANLMLQKARLDKTPKALALTITNLTEGKAYLVQILYHSGTAREKDLSVDGVNYYDCQKTGGENSNRFGWSFNLRFVASAESETINLTTQQEYLQVNAIQLREISLGSVLYYDKDGAPAKDTWDVEGDATLYALWNRDAMYKVGVDQSGTTSWNSTPADTARNGGWASSRDGTAGSHTVSEKYDYIVVPNAVLRTPVNNAIDPENPLVFNGHSLTLEGTLALKQGGDDAKGREEYLRIDRLIGAGGSISPASATKTTLTGESITIQDDSSLRISTSDNKTRHLYVKPPISGAGDLILALGKSSASERYSTILTLEGDNSGFTGAIKAIQPDDWENRQPSQYDFYVMGGFGGTVESLPDIGSNYVRFRYDGLVGDQGLRISTNEVSDVIRERIILYSDTQDFDAEDLPLMTFPEGTEVDPAAFTVRHATGTNGTGTAFIRLGVVTNSNATISLVANCAPKLPEDYTALDYLDNGIDPATAGFVQVTGFKLAGANIVELKFSVNVDAQDRWQTLFMSRVKNGAYSADYGLFRGHPAGSKATLTYHHRDDSGAAAVGNEGATNINTDLVVRLGPSKDDCKINGEAMILNLEPDSYSTSLTNDLLIFATDKNTVCDGYPYLKRVNDGSLVNPALAKMYYFQVFASSTDLTPRLDLVPASNTLSHAVGLYDLVGNEFYPLRHPCPGATVVDGHAVDEWHHADPSLTACGYDCGVCTSCLMRISKMIPPVQGASVWRWDGNKHWPGFAGTNDWWDVTGCTVSYNPNDTNWTDVKKFSATFTLTNNCVWADGSTTSVVYNYECLDPEFNVIRADGPKIVVEKTWLDAVYGNNKEYNGYQKALFETNANGVAAWQAYVLGVGATPEAVANAAILEESVQNANPETVTIKLRDWETLTPRTNENCRLAYSLLSARTTSELLANGGTVVTNKCVSPSVPYEKCQEWSFEAPLSDLTDEEPVNYYRIKVHFIFNKSE